MAVFVVEIILNSIYNLALLTDRSNSGYGDMNFNDNKAYFTSNNGSGPYESLRLKDYYSEVEPITLSKSDFEKVAQKHHDALVNWANSDA